MNRDAVRAAFWNFRKEQRREVLQLRINPKSLDELKAAAEPFEFTFNDDVERYHGVKVVKDWNLPEEEVQLS